MTEADDRDSKMKSSTRSPKKDAENRASRACQFILQPVGDSRYPGRGGPERFADIRNLRRIVLMGPASRALLRLGRERKAGFLSGRSIPPRGKGPWRRCSLRSASGLECGPVHGLLP